MARLSLAFLLALGSHVFLFFMVLPGQGDNHPQIQGIRQVTVRLFHPAPEPVDKIEEVSLAALEEVAAPIEEVIEKNSEPDHEEQPVHIPPPQVQPEKRKIIPPPDVIKEKEQVKETAKRIDTYSKEEKESQQVVRRTTGSGRPVQQGSEAAAVYQAVPIYQSNQPPEYPDLARRRGWEGTVLLDVDVSVEGLARSVRVHTTSSYDLLDNAALDAVKRWHFKPGMKGGQPVVMRVLVPVHFVFKDTQ